MNITYKVIFFAIGFISISFTHPADAAEPYNNNGWMTPIAQLVATSTACASSSIALDLEILEYGTNNPISGIDAIFLTYNKTTNTLLTSVSGAGSLIGPICVDPDRDGVAVDIDGSASYYNFYTSNVWSNSADIPRGNHYREKVWLSPVSGTAQYPQVSPINFAITGINPTYQFDLNVLPTTYGANAIKNFQFFLVDSSGNFADKRTVALTGGTGAKILPETIGLADGVYQWGGYVALNGTNVIPVAGGNFEVLDVLKTGLAGFGLPFMYDKTSPVVLSQSHTPNSPTSTQQVTVTTSSTDALSGIANIKTYIDGVLVKTCSYAGAQTATCISSTGLYSENTSHLYFSVVTDRANNVATSTTQSFTIPMFVAEPSTVINAISCEYPSTTIMSSGKPVNSSNFGIPQALDIEGNYAYLGTADNSSTNGMFIYDISDPENILQKSFFSTQNPASVQNNSWGNDVLGIDVYNGYAYLATYYGGLVIVDISDPNNPLFSGKIALNTIDSGSPESWDVKVRGNYAFMASGKGMIVVDVSNKNNPVIVAKNDLGASVSQSITLAGSYAYIAMRDNGLAIIDISDPLTPVVKSQFNDAYNGSNWAYSVAVNGTYLYVANNYAGTIHIYDVTNKSKPVFVSSTPTEGSTIVKAVRIVDGVLYVGARDKGAYVFDISNPSNPTLAYRVVNPPLSDSLGRKIWTVLPLPGNNFKKLIMVSADFDTGPGVYVTETSCDVAPLPDLTVSDTTMPGNADTLTPVSLNAEITNSGTVGTVAGFTNLFQKTNDIITNSSPLINIGTSTLPLLPAQTSADSSLQYTFPNSDASTTQYVRVCTDKSNATDTGTITESDETNNCSAWKQVVVSATSPAVDLVASSVTPADNSIYKSGSINFSGTVQNIGTSNVIEGGFAGLEVDWDFLGGIFNVDEYFAIPDNSTMLGTFSNEESKPLSFLLSNVPTGVHAYRFNVDSTDQLSELDESNNSSVWKTITVINGDLNASSYSIQGGEFVTLDWSTINTSGLDCTVSDGGGTSWSGNSSAGVDTSVLDSDVTYTLSCDGVLLDSVTISVNSTPELTIIPRIVPINGSATLLWNTHNGDESLCTLKNGPNAPDLLPDYVGGDPNAGFASITVLGRSRYTLSCPNGTKVYEVEIVPSAFES